jgi:EAL domain-containing protein (putative c-di-GMP-specific phosphodiesterase class I)
MHFKSPLFQSAYQLWYGPDLVHIQSRRERRALMLGSLGMFVMGLTWGVYFISIGNWPIVGFDLLLTLSGLSAAVLVWRKQTHAAAIVIFASLFCIVSLIAWLFDAATPQAPRTTHLYLLPLSVAALMVFRDAGAWLRQGIAAASLLVFALLSVSYGSPLSQFALPADVRATGAWIQSIAAMALLYGMLHVMQNDSAIRSILEDELQQAMEGEQFQLHYQPQLDSQGRVIAAEALIRWIHPQQGMVLPGKFIEIAEQTGQILPIGLWVLQQACAQLQAWSGVPSCKHLRLAVNISQLQFRQKDFVSQVLHLIDHYGIQSDLLELELTESMLAQDLQDIVRKMTALRARGVTFSLDDFGTGYSSLNYLKKLPLNQLKIDQSFVRDVLTDANDASIARTVVLLGHDLGLTVIAEGVESAAQHAFLVGCGCEFFQGSLFSFALPAEAFIAYVQANAEVPGLAAAA